MPPARSILRVPSPRSVPPVRSAPPVRAERRDRRRLLRHDLLSARLAELDRIGVLLHEATTLVGAGWVQHAWFAYRDPAGQGARTRVVATGHDLRVMGGAPVSGACLVGAVVQAGGGPATADPQLVNRALDLVWHALHETGGRRVEWCPSPPVRAAHVHDLTRWNDAPTRDAAAVASLLDVASRVALVEVEQVRQERARL